MLYREIMAVCSQIHTKHINALCGQNVELLNVKTGGTYSDQRIWKSYCFIMAYIGSPQSIPNAKLTPSPTNCKLKIPAPLSHAIRTEPQCSTSPPGPHTQSTPYLSSQHNHNAKSDRKCQINRNEI